jgi:hypothetical protein
MNVELEINLFKEAERVEGEIKQIKKDLGQVSALGYLCSEEQQIMRRQNKIIEDRLDALEKLEKKDV